MDAKPAAVAGPSAEEEAAGEAELVELVVPQAVSVSVIVAASRSAVSFFFILVFPFRFVTA